MDIAPDQTSIVIISNPYNYQQCLTQWLFKNDNDIEIPIIFDIYQHDNATRVVTEDWTLHIDHVDGVVKMMTQTPLGRTLYSEGRDELLESLVKTVNSYMASLPDNLEHVRVGFEFNFVIRDMDNPKRLNHIFTSSPQEFEQLFGNQYEFSGIIKWEHAKYKVQTTVEFGDVDAGVKPQIVLNYHRNIQSANKIRAALPSFISVNENAHMVVHKLLEKADG